MKVLLVNPSEGPDADYGALAKAATELPQLGLASVAASLHGGGHTVRVLDFFVEHANLKSLLDLIREEEYKVVGFSVYITTEKKTFYLSQKIKEAFPDIKICVGGPQVTFVFFQTKVVSNLLRIAYSLEHPHILATRKDKGVSQFSIYIHHLVDDIVVFRFIFSLVLINLKKVAPD